METTTPKKRNKRNLDLTGQRFGLLTVIGISDRTAPRGARRMPLWKCRCDCGIITYKATDILRNKSKSSCANCAQKNAIIAARAAAGYVGGTQISRIKDMKPIASNTSGYRGVNYEKNSGKWRARLRFQGHIMSFGSYEKFEDAVEARKAAEEKYFGAFLAHQDK